MVEQVEMPGIEGLPARKARPRVRSGGYRHPLKVYAERIWPDKRVDNSTRTLKRWKDLGGVEDPPPFDRLELLAEWFERHHKWKASEALTRFRDGEPEVVEEKPAAAPVPAAVAPADADAMPAWQLDLDAEMTVDTGLRQIRSLVLGTYEQMQIALKNNQAKHYQTLRREWQSSVTLLRQWEKDVTKIQEGRGEVLRTRVINSELVQIFTALGQSFFNALIQTLQVHAPQVSPEERWKIAVEQRDKIFSHLNQSRFASAWVAPEPLTLEA